MARRLGLPRETVRDWRVGRSPYSGPRCPRCWQRTKPIVIEPEAYAELLGLYLGDGSISRLARTYHLRLALDPRYPGIIADACALLNRTFPANRVGLLPSASNGTAIPYVYSRHLPCAFPQHGRGKKHERRISLERWQEDLVAQAPWALLRGLIRSDGCVFINRTGPYRYESYGFYNRSTDILDLFARTCDQVGVAYRRNHRAIRINRRTAVAAMLQHVGRKS